MNASNITSMNSLGLEQPGGKFHMGSTPLGATKNRHFCAAPESLEVLFVPKNYHLIRRGHNLLRFLVQKANYSLSQQSGKTSQEKKQTTNQPNQTSQCVSRHWKCSHTLFLQPFPGLMNAELIQPPVHVFRSSHMVTKENRQEENGGWNPNLKCPVMPSRDSNSWEALKALFARQMRLDSPFPMPRNKEWNEKGFATHCKNAPMPNAP